MFGELISYKGHWASLLQSQHPSLQGDCQISRKNCLRYISRTGGQQSVSVDATVMGRHGRHQKQKHIPQDCAKHWPCRTYSMQLQFMVVKTLAGDFDPYMDDAQGTTMGNDYWGRSFFHLSKGSDE